ncbi:DUF2088 domain-containing protein [Bacteroidota bacterium]
MNFNLNKIRQHFEQNSLTDVRGEAQNELKKLERSIKPGANIALAVGSRGIDNLVLIVKEVVEFLKRHGAHPFIIPAMGSHGGAVAHGQIEVLSSYGITEEAIGVPVHASMDVVEVPCPGYKDLAYMDKFAFESDGVILINRIKPHTDYHAEYESGLVKMMVIGMGKEMGASAIHRHGVYGLSELLKIAAKQIIATGKIIGGVALVENAYDQTMLVEVLKGEDILEKEPPLLKTSVDNMPTFPVKNFDVLIIDQMGKNISGVCIDTNIIGRMMIRGQAEPDFPDIKSIVVLDLTEESHGNALGVGLADIITRKLFNKIDFDVTYKNVYTASFLARAKIPIIADNGNIAMDFALRSCGVIVPGEERIIRIKDTLHLDEMYVSDAILAEIKELPGLEILDKACDQLNSESEFNQF